MQYSSPSRSIVIAGDGRSIPADPANTDFAGLLADGVAIAEFAAPPPVDADVTSEYERRLYALLGARDLAHAAFIRADNDVEMRRLELAAGRTPDAIAWLKELQRVDRAVAALIECYNAMPSPPPLDYTADDHWQSRS